MLSSDQNVETIAQLVEIVKNYLGLQGEYLKLDVIDKLVSLLKAFALALFFFIFILAVFTYFSIAAAFWMASSIGYVWAFLIVGMFHLLLFLLIVHFRKPWIERPLVRFLANLFLGQ